MSDADSSFCETAGNEFWRQCWRGDVDAVRKALRDGTDVNEVGNRDGHLLMRIDVVLHIPATTCPSLVGWPCFLIFVFRLGRMR